MKAVQITRFGGPDALSVNDVARPAAGEGEIVIRVVASGYNPIESKIRNGAMARALGRPLPVILGWECAGVVESTGARAGRFHPGDSVFAYVPFTRDGTHAELVAVNEAHVARMPKSLSFEQAAAVPLTAQAAWTLLAAGRVTPDDRVLIHGAGGAVGHWLVQLVKAQGAPVSATVTDERRMAVRALGADEVIDYQRRRFEELGQFTVVFDLVGGETQERSWALLRPAGRLVSSAMPPPEGRAKATGTEGVFVFTQPRGDVLEQIGARIESHALRPLVPSQVVPFEGAGHLHERAETGALKTVLLVAPGRARPS
jgi:NADPH:quinone reductase-like Zn-dependent oxidoreductase